MNNEEQERFNLIKSLAEQGNSEAQLCLGFRYNIGNGVTQDKEKASKWINLSAEQGNEMAQFTLGEFYYFGEGVEQNYNEAFKWFKLSAEQGNNKAQVYFGDCYYHGRGVEKNYGEAFKWFKLSAEQGNKYAQNYLAECLYNGTGTEQNHKEAVKWVKLSAEQGNRVAQRRLADCYYYGNGIEQNYEECLKWLTLSAEQGDEEAKEKLETLKYLHFDGTINYQGKLVTKKELDAITKQEDYQYKNFALFHRCFMKMPANTNVKLITKNEISMTIEELKEKSEQGDAEAQFFLGNECYEKGDYEEAYKWWKLSAEQGVFLSQYNIGAMIFGSFEYMQNHYNRTLFLDKKPIFKGTWLGEQGIEQSFKWFYMAAENGIGKAQTKVGQAFFFGCFGVEANHDEAITWYEKAFRNGETDVATNLSTLYLKRKEYSKAFKYAREAAKEGGSMDYYNVGLMYLDGIGVKQDPFEAYIWIKRAADLNFGLAEHAIGRMLLTGWGVKQDVNEAIKYFKKAAKQGDIESENLLAKIEKRTQVFVSYSHKDEQYEKELREHLESLTYSGIINYWDDEKIEVGENIDAVIEEEMSKAKVIIFLVSPSFMSSRYVRTVELDRLIDAAESEGARIIWIPVRSCLINETRLEKYRGLIDKNEFLADKEKLSDRDKIYTKAAKVIMEQVKK